MKHTTILTALLITLSPAQEPQSPAAHPPSHAGGFPGQPPPPTESDPDKLTNQPMAEIMRRLDALEEAVNRERAREGRNIHPSPPPAKPQADAQDNAVAQAIARAEYDDARTRYEYQVDLLRQLHAKLAEEEITLKTSEKPQTDAERAAFERGMAELKRTIRSQEETVEQERQLLAQIVRARGMIYSGRDSDHRAAGGAPGRDALSDLNHLEHQVAQLRKTTETLLRYHGDELIAFAAGLDMAEGPVRTLHPRYVAMKAELAGLKNKGLGHEHPLMIAKNKELEAIRKQLEAGIVAFRDNLQAKLLMTEAKLAHVRAEREAHANAQHKADTEVAPDDIRQRLDRIERMLEQVLRRLEEKPAESPAE